MNVALVTPLYPPDIAPPAIYVKELARRLSETHKVSIVAYAHIPEDVPGVLIFPVSKRLPVVERILRFFTVLYQATKQTDHLYVVNGPSVELPVLLLSYVRNTPITLCIVDAPAFDRTRQQWLTNLVHKTLCKRAVEIITDIPLQKPEVLPFASLPDRKAKSYEESWKRHLALLSP